MFVTYCMGFKWCAGDVRIFHIQIMHIQSAQHTYIHNSKCVRNKYQ